MDLPQSGKRHTCIYNGSCSAPHELTIRPEVDHLVETAELGRPVAQHRRLLGAQVEEALGVTQEASDPLRTQTVRAKLVQSRGCRSLRAAESI